MMCRVDQRFGAYLLPGDPVWLRSSLSRYYDLLDDLVVLVPEGHLGWNGYPLPVEACLQAVAEVDARGIARMVGGTWRNKAEPMVAETAQRQAGIEALSQRVDWILQIDNDEVLPDPQALVEVVAAVAPDVVGVEWPMRVLYRRRRDGSYLQVVGERAETVHEYPGSVAVRSGARLCSARRVDGQFVRVRVSGDRTSLQLARPPEARERREVEVEADAAIVHNSWARRPAEVWRKTRSWGHAAGAKGVAYYLTRWLPAPLTWRRMRDFHPFASGLWPRLAPVRLPAGLLVPQDDADGREHD